MTIVFTMTHTLKKTFRHTFLIKALVLLLPFASVFSDLRYAFDENTFWKGFDSQTTLFNLLIKKHLPQAKLVGLTEHPDVIICGVFKENADQKIPLVYQKKYGKNVRTVCWSQEARGTMKNNGLYDHYFSFVREFSKENTFLPNWLYRVIQHSTLGDNAYLNAVLKLNRMPDGKRSKFCVFMHRHGSLFRDTFFTALSNTYSKVDSVGRHLNNVSFKAEPGVDKKISVLKKYRFALSMENRSMPNYCTEKLLDAFASGCLPIYHGDPDVYKDFSKGTFINVNDYTSIKDVFQLIKQLDRDQGKYRSYFKGYITSKFIRDLVSEKRDTFEKRIVSMTMGVEFPGINTNINYLGNNIE